MTSPARDTYALRCDRCHHYLDDVAEPMELVAIFRASALGVVPRTHPQEYRARCRHCGFVNLFIPMVLTGYGLGSIVVK